MKCIRAGHYQTTIAYGHSLNIIVNIVKVTPRFQDSVTKWRLTIDDTLIKNQHNSDWDSYATAKRKAIRMCENLLMNDIIRKIEKAFPRPKVKQNNNLVELRR
jgi:hypothetical protein